MKKNSIFLIVITVLSFLFFIAVGSDFFPFLRGPAPYPPNWQWPYQFTNTLSKIWLPIVVFLAISFQLYLIESNSMSLVKKHIKVILFFLFISSFVFQISVLYFSRAGIPVIIHRIINPDLNGYFSAALNIQNISNFLKTYNEKVLSFPMHATGHPPGSIFFFLIINNIVQYLPFISKIASLINPSHIDVQLLWNSLSLTQKSGALLSAFIIPLLSSTVIFPLYLIGIELYSIRIALRSLFLYMFIPSIVLFIPISDVIFPIFSLWSFLLFLKGLKNKNHFMLVFSGILFYCGLFFSLSLLPLLVIFVYFFFTRKTYMIQQGISFLFGLVITPLLLLFMSFNFIQVTLTLMSGLPKERKYHIWIFYNLLDFFIFSGIPIFIVYITMFLNKYKEHLFVGFSIMLFLLNFSGSVRGEVGRIWIPFYSFITIFIAHFITKEKIFSTKAFYLFISIQFLQILIMQEFWVTLW